MDKKLDTHALMRFTAYMRRKVEIFKAVGEETRLRIMRLLIKADTELCACEIIDVLEKPQYTISKSLKVLVNSGLVDERREGRMMYYSLIYCDSVIKKLYEAISEIKSDESEAFRNDFDALEKRLSQRENNSCVICNM